MARRLRLAQGTVMNRVALWLALCICALLGLSVRYLAVPVDVEPSPPNAPSGRGLAEKGPQAVAPALVPAAANPVTGDPPLPTGEAEPPPNTGEFIDADSPVPPQAMGDATVSMDTGPFIDADAPVQPQDEDPAAIPKDTGVYMDADAPL